VWIPITGFCEPEEGFAPSKKTRRRRRRRRRRNFLKS
jgi:hypothetical protein